MLNFPKMLMVNSIMVGSVNLRENFQKVNIHSNDLYEDK